MEETLMKKRVLLLVVVLLLVAVGIVNAQGPYPNPGTSVTNAIIQNLATGAGDTATLTIDYYAESGGSPVYSNSTVTIPPKSVVEVKTANEQLPAGFTGSAVISSDQTLAAVTSIRNTAVPGAADGTTQGAYNGANTGTDTLFFPSYWAFEFIVSRITVQNTELGEAEIDLNFFRRDGTFIGTMSDTLAANGSKTYCGCEPSDWPGGTIPANYTDGAVTVTSTNGNLLAGASTATRNSSSSAYQALSSSDEGTVLYAPSSFRFNNGTPIAQGSAPTLLSAVNVQNTSDSLTAPVTIEFYNRDTGALDLTLTWDIAPGSAVGANNYNGGDFDAALFAALLPDGDWDGSVKIISDNDIPLVGTGITRWGKTDKTTMYALIPQEKAAVALNLPAQYRLDYGSGSMKQWSSLNLQNVGSTTVAASDILIEYVDTSGTVVASFTGNQLPGDLDAGAAVGLNTKNGGDLAGSAFDVLGTDFIGGIVVTISDASGEFVATANIVYTNRASSYNAAQ
jgi:hypothetical protein